MLTWKVIGPEVGGSQAGPQEFTVAVMFVVGADEVDPQPERPVASTTAVAANAEVRRR